MILILFSSIILFFALIVIFFLFLMRSTRHNETLRILKEGFKEGLKGSGFLLPKTRYPVELYVWETSDDGEVCEDCTERAAWPPMDIADWIKEGLPRTEEAYTHCGKNCRCQLIPFHPRKQVNQFPFNI